MNKLQKDIIYTLKKYSPRFPTGEIPLGYITHELKMDRKVIERELDILEIQEHVRINKQEFSGSVLFVTLLNEGIDAYKQSALNQNTQSMHEQLRDVRELINSLQEAVDAIERNGTKDPSLMDKLSKHINNANTFVNLVKNVTDLYEKLPKLFPHQ